MDSYSNSEVPNPKRLKTLASDVSYPNKNNLLHQFVLDNCDPNNLVSQSCINAVLVAMNGSAVDVNALNGDGYTPLDLAVLKCNLLMVKKLLSCLVNIDVNARCDVEKEEITALHLAVKLGHLSIIEELLNKGADANIKDRYDCTTLYFAIKSGNLGIVKLLVSKGADVDLIHGEWGALHCAARSGNIEVVKFLVSNGANVNDKGEDGLTPLHCAARSGGLPTVEYLVSQGADVNAINELKLTALYYASRSGSLDIIKFLLDSGANVNIGSGDELVGAAESGDMETIQFLIDKGADINATDKADNRTPLHYAVKWCNLEAIKCLVDNGADLNSIDEDYQTPLHRAMDRNDDEVVQFLVGKGANVNAIDIKGQTPLHRLLDRLKYSLDPYYNKETDIGSYNVPVEINKGLMKIQLLLEANADVNIEDKYGNTPLRYAIDFTNSDIVKLLLERDVDLNVRYIDDDTIVHRACISDDKLDVIEILLTKGCDVNAKNKFGQTPLHAAVCRNNADYTQLLLERGASVHIADIDGWTPLHIAACYGYVEVVRALLDKGGDRNAINKDGETPLDLAKENDHQLCMDALQ